MCWNKQAENVFKFCGKGSRICVSGMMTTRSWEDNEGNKRTAYEVVANEIEFLQKKAEGTSNAQSTNNAPTMDADADGFVVVEEDDLPF